MDRYEAYLFVHIAAAIVWIGAGFTLQVLAIRAERAADAEGMRRIAADGAGLSTLVFMPASFVALIFGVLMVVDGPWGFGELWIVIGLVGFVASSMIGGMVLGPGAAEVAATAEREGGTSASAQLAARRFFALARIDLVVLYAVVAVMVLKPTGDDVGVLAALAAAVAAGVALSLLRVRALDAEAAPAGSVAA